MMMPRLLRAAAVVIAVAAVIDPVVVRQSVADAVVAVVSNDTEQDGALAARVASSLDPHFKVVRGAYPGAAAVVVAGSELPHAFDLPAVPLFVVQHGHRVAIRSVEAPATAPVSGGIEITVSVDVARSGSVRVRLLRDEIPVDEVDIPEASVGSARVSFSAAPEEAGSTRFRVEAESAGEVVAADAVVDVVADRWRVLFHDGRPSWMSTFVRRSLEVDPRFETSARVATSQNVGVQFGATGTLQDLASSSFDLVVVGAPELLTPAEVSALDRFMRDAGGAVLLLMDRVGDTTFARLAGVTEWRPVERPAPTGLVSQASPVLRSAAEDTTALLRAAHHLSPRTLPAGARTVLQTPEGDAVVWRVAIGRGQVIASGALDAWRYRTGDMSRFNEFWPRLAAEAAAGSPAHVEVTGDRIAAPGEWIAVDVATTADVLPVAHIGAETAETQLELHALAPGRYRGEFRAPSGEGVYRVSARAGVHEAAMSLVVDAQRARTSSGAGQAEALALASGGSSITAADLPELQRRLRETLRDARSPQPWRPMRSAWWLLPFTAALAGEWLWRRRRGLA